MIKEKKVKTKKILHHGHGFFFITPIRHFTGLLIASFVALIALVGVHLYFFYKINSHNSFAVTTTTNKDKPSINQTKLQSVLDQFKAKESRRDEALTLTPSVNEPSSY